MSATTIPTPSRRRLWAVHGTALAMVLALVAVLALAPPPGRFGGPVAPDERLTDTVLVTGSAVIERSVSVPSKGLGASDVPSGVHIAPRCLSARPIGAADVGEPLPNEPGDPCRHPRAPPAHPA